MNGIREHKSPTVAVGDEFVTRVVSTNDNGEGIVYLEDGRVCFLTKGIPALLGDWVRLCVVLSGARYAQAEVLEILPKPSRVTRTWHSEPVAPTPTPAPAPAPVVAKPAPKPPVRAVFNSHIVGSGEALRIFVPQSSFPVCKQYAGKMVRVHMEFEDTPDTMNFVARLTGNFKDSAGLTVPRAIVRQTKAGLLVGSKAVIELTPYD